MSNVSVIIPCFNSERFIVDAVRSALSQGSVVSEVLVTDDGSTDNSYELAIKESKRDSRVRVLIHEGHANRGVSASRAAGVGQCTGEYVAFLDADDIFLPHKTARQLELFRQYPEAILSHSMANLIYENPSDAGLFANNFKVYTEETTYQFLERPDWIDSNPICNSSVMVRADLLKQCCHEFDQVFQYEDWLLLVLLGLLGPFIYTPEPLVQYRYHSASATARIVKNERLGLYSYVEFLMALFALLPPDGRMRFESVIGLRFKTSIMRLAATYARDGQGVSPECLSKVLLSDGDKQFKNSVVMIRELEEERTAGLARLIFNENRVSMLEAENSEFKRYYGVGLLRRSIRKLSAMLKHES
jgi:glycosyltransferase involved in cell wall biosynthesis